MFGSGASGSMSGAYNYQQQQQQPPHGNNYGSSNYSPDPVGTSSSHFFSDINATTTRAASTDGALTNVAAAFDALHPMYRAMRDLESQKARELQQMRDALAAKDIEIGQLRKRVRQLEQEARLGPLSGHSTENLLSPIPSPSSAAASALNNSGTMHHQQQNRGVGGLSGAATPTPTMQKQQQQQQRYGGISEQERLELEEMLSRSIAGLAEAERALVSERTRFLVADPTLIAMDRWRAAVSRLADLHDEVAHRRFGACLAAAKLSGQLPNDVGQVAAAQFLRGALSPVLLQHMAACFKRRTEEDAAALAGDPWRRAEQQLAEEPDMLLHHVNAVIERLVLDPGDDFST